MTISNELVNEINLLLQFDLSSSQAGIKVHSSASAENVAAAQRLYDKGMIDQVDGGYLTHLGRECAEHAQSLSRIMNAKATA